MAFKRSRLYVVWMYYGERGVTVCDEWRDYCPENCRWIPFSDQRENTRQTRKITINGETITIKSWCRKYGISYDMVMMRIHRGMDDVSALLTPKERR